MKKKKKKKVDGREPKSTDRKSPESATAGSRSAKDSNQPRPGKGIK